MSWKSRNDPGKTKKNVDKYGHIMKNHGFPEHDLHMMGFSTSMLVYRRVSTGNLAVCYGHLSFLKPVSN
jgi:hypothetical protein